MSHYLMIGKGFLSISSNNTDLANFVSEELVDNSAPDKTVVVAGGFVNDTTIACNKNIDESELEGIHEEGDTTDVHYFNI